MGQRYARTRIGNAGGFPKLGAGAPVIGATAVRAMSVEVADPSPPLAPRSAQDDNGPLVPRSAQDGNGPLVPRSARDDNGPLVRRSVQADSGRPVACYRQDDK